MDEPPTTPPLPDERPQRRREYTGSGSTLGVAAVIILAVGLAIWFFELRGGAGGEGGDEFGIRPLPEGTNATGQAPAARQGRAAPNFVLPTLDGTTATLEGYRGKYVLVNFWASWCGPCRGETPDLDALQREQEDRLVVLGVNIQESDGAAREFVRQFNLGYPILLDRDGEVTNAYRAKTPPSSYLVGPDGVILETYTGRLTKEQIAIIVREYLG